MSMYFKLKKVVLEGHSISYHPRIKVTLSYGVKSKQVVAVLDTGSDLIYLPKNVADYFELPLSKEIFEARTPNGTSKYTCSKMYVEVKKGHEFLKDLFDVVVPQDELHNEIILGVPFLSKFSATFDYLNEKIILKKTVKKI